MHLDLHILWGSWQVPRCSDMASMRHLFINTSHSTVPTWREAFPDGCEMAWGELQDMEPVEAGLIWLRLLEHEAHSVLGAVRQKVKGPVVILSDMPSEAAAATCMAAGAMGYCNTHAAPQVLQQIGAVVAQGGMWLGQELMQRLMGSAATLMARQAPVVEHSVSLEALTEREADVARRVASGASNREIAEQLGITERTVKAHLGTVFGKLQVRDRLQLSLKVNGLWP